VAEKVFTWLSVDAFKRLSPKAKQAYLRKLVTHVTNELVDRSWKRAKKSQRHRAT